MKKRIILALCSFLLITFYPSRTVTATSSSINSASESSPIIIPYANTTPSKQTTISLSNFHGGATIVKVVLSSHMGGVPEWKDVMIHWTGSEAVSSLSASKIIIKNNNSLKPTVYFNKGFHRAHLSSPSGFVTIGSCTIPNNIKHLKVTSKNLTLTLYSSETVLRVKEIDGYINL